MGAAHGEERELRVGENAREGAVVQRSEGRREFKVKKTRNENLYHQSRVTRRGELSTSPRRDILQRLP